MHNQCQKNAHNSQRKNKAIQWQVVTQRHSITTHVKYNYRSPQNDEITVKQLKKPSENFSTPLTTPETHAR